MAYEWTVDKALTEAIDSGEPVEWPYTWRCWEVLDTRERDLTGEYKVVACYRVTGAAKRKAVKLNAQYWAKESANA